MVLIRLLVVFFMAILPSKGIKLLYITGKIVKITKYWGLLGIIFYFPSLDVILETLYYG